jgi:hypothetical protein
MYQKSIKMWLNQTPYIIIVVENSGYHFPIKHKRLVIISTKMLIPNDCKFRSSFGEAKSIDFAIQKIKNKTFYINSTHILKVTGKYFLPHIDLELQKLTNGFHLYLQKRRYYYFGSSWQNSEYFGIQKEFIQVLCRMVMKHKERNFEDTFYKFSLSYSYTFFPNQFENVMKSKRNDDSYYNYL